MSSKFSSAMVAFLAAILVTFSTDTANAVTYTFDLTGSTSTQSSFTVPDGSALLSVLVTGFTSGGAQSINRDSNGMGVYSGGNDSTQTDGVGPDETIRFDLGTAILQLTQATFALVGSDDDFTLTVNGVYQGQADIPSGLVFNFGGSYIGSLFDFGVASSNDDYKLTSVKFSDSCQGCTTGTEVPEPATMLLLGSGIGLLGLGRKKLAC